jgi:peptidoglycan/LPS O-acetylase OafA/YrhL
MAKQRAIGQNTARLLARINILLRGLDGIRCLAMLLVIAVHFRLVWFGWVGLQMFFVMSGLLITRLLIDHADESPRDYFLKFYGRRALRIFPAFYAFLLVFLVISWLIDTGPRATQYWPYAATYIYNWVVALDPEKHRFFIGHFWSLCVEEQFYLVWPLIIYFTPRQHLKKVMLGIILLAPVCRYLTFYVWPWFADSSWPAHSVYVLPMTHMDAFAMGALIAIHPFKADYRHFWGSLVVLFGLGWLNSQIYVEPGQPVFTSGLFYRLPLERGEQFVWGYSAINICTAIMVCAIARRQLLTRFFEHPIVDYIGRISYPTYILNLPLVGLMAWIFGELDIAIMPNSYWFVIVCLIPTFALASLTHHYIEIPCNALKDRWFRYRQRTDQEKAVARVDLVPYQQELRRDSSNAANSAAGA